MLSKKNKKILETRLHGFIFVLISSALAACNGGGGGGGDSSSDDQRATPVTPTIIAISAPAKPDNNATVQQCPTTSLYNIASPPPQNSGAIVGRITYERVPFFASNPPGGRGLDYGNIQTLPARGVVVEAMKASDDDRCDTTVIATTLSDGDGWYRLTTGTTKVCVRARAQLYRAADTNPANWNFAVADNTNANSLFSMIEPVPTTADVQPRRDLHAPSGWSMGGYNSERIAAPFAILDTACQAMNAVLNSRSATSFGSLTFMWSTKNTNDASGTREQGKIGGAFFDGGQRAIYLRGDADVNTDEFDPMVIAHEFGHFVIQVLSRSDSIGGDHSLEDKLDPRLAFDEGWATGFASLALKDPIYRDSDEGAPFGSLFREFSFDVRVRYINASTGWFSESSVQRALYSLGSDIADGGTGMGLGALLQTLAGSYKQTDALASIFSYGEFLKNEQSSYASAIASALNMEQMDGNGVTAFAISETHAPSNFDLPVYTALDGSGTRKRVCSSDAYGTENTLSNRRYLKFTPVQTARYRFNVDPITNGIAGIELIDRGSTTVYVEGSAAGVTLVASSGTLQSGRSYVLGVFHTGNAIKDSVVASGDKCFDVWAQAF